MLQNLSAVIMSKKRIIYFVLFYAALRVFSYFFTPQTPLLAQTAVNTLVSAGILLLSVYWLLKKDIRGWFLIAAEIILGGGGGYLAVAGISLRTCLLAVSLFIYFTQTIIAKKLKSFTDDKNILYLLAAIILWSALAAARGIMNNHDIHLVIADFIPYLFFLYYFPLRELWAKEDFSSILFEMLTAAVFGGLIFIILTFIGFSSGIFVLQDSYYHWFRDVAGGKITDLGFNFYRLILNEQLLLVPLLLYFIHKLIRDREKGFCFLVLALIIILSVNFTRIYYVALAVGLLLLYNKNNWRRWLMYSAISVLALFVSFTALHLLSSRGQSLGWELLGLRLQSIAAPQIEESSLSRMLLLPKILEKIKTNPFLGNGLGDTVTVYSPVLKETITTPHFDWGYLEIIDELGVFGLMLWVALMICLILSVFRRTNRNSFYFASLFALLVINTTSPALFHVFGVIWLTAIIAQNQPTLLHLFNSEK